MCKQGISALDFLAKMNGKRFPFVEIIRHLEGKEVIMFENLGLLQTLKTVCANVITHVNLSGYSGRINEFGNHVEPFFFKLL